MLKFLLCWFSLNILLIDDGENNNGDGDCGDVVVDVGGCGNKDEG